MARTAAGVMSSSGPKGWSGTASATANPVFLSLSLSWREHHDRMSWCGLGLELRQTSKPFGQGHVDVESTRSGSRPAQARAPGAFWPRGKPEWTACRTIWRMGRGLRDKQLRHTSDGRPVVGHSTPLPGELGATGEHFPPARGGRALAGPRIKGHQAQSSGLGHGLEPGVGAELAQHRLHVRAKGRRRDPQDARRPRCWRRGRSRALQRSWGERFGAAAGSIPSYRSRR